MTYTNSFQQYQQIIDRINEGIDQEAHRQYIEHENAFFEFMHYLWVYNLPHRFQRNYILELED